MERPDSEDGETVGKRRQREAETEVKTEAETEVGTETDRESSAGPARYIGARMEDGDCERLVKEPQGPARALLTPKP